MPATSPRFTITVPRDTDSALKRLAGVQGRSVASLIREYLEGITPTLVQLADAMETVRQMEVEARAELVGSLAEVEAEMRPHMVGIMDHLRALVELGGDQSDADGAGGASVEGRLPHPRRQPPPCNTGVVNG